MVKLMPIIILIVSLIVGSVLAAYYLGAVAFPNYQYNLGEYHGGYGMGMMGNGIQQPRNKIAGLSLNEAVKMIEASLPNAREFPNNTIVFNSTYVNLVVFTMGAGRAENLTGHEPPYYARGDVFVIGGLIDPTIVLPAGAEVHVTVINLDDNMYHNFVIVTTPPPYPYNVMMNTMMGGGISMMPLLPPAHYFTSPEVYEGQAYSFQYDVSSLPEGQYWYLCTYPGHAQIGMYGELVVE